MNNTAENDFLGFPKVKWLHLTGEVDKSVRFSYQIFSGFNMPKIVKIVKFLIELFKKNKRWTFFGTRGVVSMSLLRKILNARQN